MGAMVLYTGLTLFLAPSIMLSRSGKEVGQALAQMDTTNTTIAFLHDYRTSTVFYSGKTIYRAEEKDRIDSMKPGALSWNAKNVMPFIAEEDLVKQKNTIIIADRNTTDAFLTAYEDTNAYPIHIPGLYTIWVRKGYALG